MAKRDIGKEIIQGLEEIKAWKKGKTNLKTLTVVLSGAGAPTDLPLLDVTPSPQKTP